MQKILFYENAKKIDIYRLLFLHFIFIFSASTLPVVMSLEDALLNKNQTLLILNPASCTFLTLLNFLVEKCSLWYFSSFYFVALSWHSLYFRYFVWNSRLRESEYLILDSRPIDSEKKERQKSYILMMYYLNKRVLLF